MPRAVVLGKRQQGSASNRDSRHDYGLVGPAKRVTRKKSGSQLEGSARPAENVSTNRQGNGHTSAGHGHSHASSQGQHGSGLAGPSSSSLPSSPQNQQQQQYQQSQQYQGQPPAVNGTSKAHLVESVPDHQPGPGDGTRRSSLGDCSETSSTSCNSNVGSSDIIEDGHRQIDVNAFKNSNVHRDSGPLELATTVLMALPMQDTLAILIILMQVPSLSLSIIYTIFTFLTFVPPVTTSSGMNINFAEIFDGSSTMPSLVTVVCMDLVFLLMWLFFWPSLQDFVLDCAKPVIAMTLGGVTNARDGGSRGIWSCFSWVLITHLIRGTKIHWSRLARYIPEGWRIPTVFAESLDASSAIYDRKNAYGLVRSILAIHILTQGIVRYVREWYIRRERVGTTSGNSSDPEAGKTHSVPSDHPHDSGGLNSPDHDSGFQATASGTKKKRKQSTQVRLQQPLWAALASTKIVVMKEYELSRAASESAGSNATDIHNLGNAPFYRQPGQIWISYLGSDDVCFSTSPFPNHEHEPPKTIRRPSLPTGVDASKPFYVRINNVFWQPTRYFPVDEEEGDVPGDGQRCSGDIYGLRPSSKYVCEFVDTRTGDVIFTTSIRTITETKREHDGNAMQDDQRFLRPDSPTSTLKISIAAAESRLMDERNRLKIMRKDAKSRLNALKRDNESADNQLATAGNQDEKHRQKIRQQETQKSQAERDMTALVDQLQNFETSPELNELKKKTERLHAAEKKVFEVAQKEFNDYKAGLEGEVNAKEAELNNLTTRQHKIANRVAKIDNELANIADANSRGLDEVERRRHARASWMAQAMAYEGNVADRLGRVITENLSLQDAANAYQSEINSLHQMMSANGIPHDSLPVNLETVLQYRPRAWNPNPAAPPHFPQGLGSGSAGDLRLTAAAPPWQPPTAAAPFEPRLRTRTRGRTSSMLSDISGFTQASEEGDERGPTRYHETQSQWAQRVTAGGSSGSGSASGSGSSGSGSIGDPTSPT